MRCAAARYSCDVMELWSISVPVRPAQNATNVEQEHIWTMEDRMIHDEGDDVEDRTEVEQEPQVEPEAEPQVEPEAEAEPNVYDEYEEYDEANTVMDDEPLAEGEQEAKIKYVVSEDIASATTFYKFCVALEAVWSAKVVHHRSKRNNKSKPPWSDAQKLWKLLPPKFLQHLQDSSTNDDTADTTTDAHHQTTVQSIFPILRLLLPEKDGSRQFQMVRDLFLFDLDYSTRVIHTCTGSATN